MVKKSIMYLISMRSRKCDWIFDINILDFAENLYQWNSQHVEIDNIVEMAQSNDR